MEKYRHFEKEMVDSENFVSFYVSFGIFLVGKHVFLSKLRCAIEKTRFPASYVVFGAKNSILVRKTWFQCMNTDFLLNLLEITANLVENIQ